MQELKHRLEKARAHFQEKMDAVLSELNAHCAAFDAAADPAARRDSLQKLSEILNRHSYIRNLVRNVSDELEEP